MERLTEYDEGMELLKNHENRIDFSAIVSLKNEVEEMIEHRSRKVETIKQK